MKIFITILAILNTYTAFGQKYVDFPSFEKFYSTFGELLKYPDGLETKQPSTVTLMKINFAANGEVQSISFSDSAFPKFVDLIQKMENKFDFKSIYEDIKIKHNSAAQVIIPIQIDYEQIGEWQSKISSDNIKKLYFFDGKPISGEYFFYPNIYYKYVVGPVNR
ncbi:hypothetical protein HS960_05420 [Sphingobacterium paramultivorum]|uniref:Uncharacterized protein n=1 Tax=Sphingobacterium paramultivorum TaxID=2886510 RepID=A0A7G5DZF3_9SPHI|nr:hypothetical protein [Sphingobacterium paramultivorum]QMV67128.1 hypothetical protein HS960_05420 [Sphingobacterium paramultivorum]WSO15976.1 hypothetical protein VUL84_05395 [Sphingobacterium paramultivorum]